MYSQDKINIALQVYHQCESVTETINVLKKDSGIDMASLKNR